MVIMMKPISTLYLVQAPFPRLESALHELQQLQQNSDAFILLEDSVFALTHPVIETFNTIYILEADSHFIPKDITTQVTTITYLQLAELIQCAQKVLTWK